MLSFCRLYADAYSLQHCDLYTKNIEIVLYHDLKILSHWSDKWLLKFNPSKTRAVFFTKKHVEEFFQGCQLDYVSTHRHHDLLFSNDLSWSQYINDIVKSAYKKFGLLKKLKFTLGRTNLSKMYITFIRSVL